MKIMRILAGIFAVFSVIFTCFYGVGKITAKTDELQAADSYKGIITLWQVDSFEGGTGSRAQFLLDVAAALEKKYKGALISVETHTAKSVNENFSNGIFPDMISYGNGVNLVGANELRVGYGFKGGEIAGKTYALPWCRGGYVLIANKSLATDFDRDMNGLLISKGEYTEPLIALVEEGYTIRDYEISSPMDAYVEFVSGKVKYFLGTQRDVNRLTRRGMEVLYKPLTAFNDLYQYVSVLTLDPQKKFYAEKFIEYLLSSSVQNKLCEIGMMSAFIEVNGDNAALNAMQKLGNFKTLSPFTSPADLEEIYDLSSKVLQGAEGAEKIKKVLI